MWIFTKDGFYSAIKDKYCNEGELMVRARVRIDLERLLAKIDSDAEILVIEQADYRYRVKLKTYQWVKYVGNAAADIDYDNVKGTVTWHEPNRSTAYHDCWQALYRLQQAELK